MYPPCANLLYFYKIKTKGSDDIGQCEMVWSFQFQGGVYGGGTHYLGV